MIKGHSFKFLRTCIVWTLQRYWLFTKILCNLLFSISVLIGQFSPKWPDRSSPTVTQNGGYVFSTQTPGLGISRLLVRFSRILVALYAKLFFMGLKGHLLACPGTDLV